MRARLQSLISEHSRLFPEMVLRTQKWAWQDVERRDSVWSKNLICFYSKIFPAVNDSKPYFSKGVQKIANLALFCKPESQVHT